MAKETKVLQSIIEKFISKKIELVQKAQQYSKKIFEYGFIEPDKTLPFQILPTEFLDSDGDIMCKLYLNLEHPMYGIFSIELLEDSCGITCPNIYIEDFFVMKYDEFERWLDLLDEEMNEFYLLSNAASEKNVNFCNLSCNEQLKNYKHHVNPLIDKIKEYISRTESIAIVSNKVYALAKDANKDYSKALLLPSAWVVFKDINNLPDEDENFDEYIDENATEILFNTLQDFFRKENYYAAPIYLAQRICLQGEIIVKGLSVTEECWQEAKATEELGEFVLPPIDIEEFCLAY